MHIQAGGKAEKFFHDRNLYSQRRVRKGQITFIWQKKLSILHLQTT
jgi:hypothetical protein